MQLVALPVDERNKPRVLPDYPEEYTPSYAESEREYLSDLAKNLQTHRESIGNPDHDPLASPIDLGVGAITKKDLVKKMSSIPKEMFDLWSDVYEPSPGIVEKYAQELQARSKNTVENVPSAITDFVDDFKYLPLDDAEIQKFREELPGGIWNLNDRVISVSPSAAVIKPSSALATPAITGHELGHAGMQLLRSILGTEDSYVLRNSGDLADKIAEARSLRPASTNEDMLSLIKNRITDPYAITSRVYNYTEIPEERVAEAFGNIVADIGPLERRIADMKGYVRPMPNDYNLAAALKRLLTERK